MSLAQSNAGCSSQLSARSGWRGTALVTGASFGIGYELAKILAQKGWALVLTARNGEKLLAMKRDFQKEHKVPVHIIAKDLALPGACREIFDETARLGLYPEILINNAGFGGSGLFTETSFENETDMIAVNIRSLTQLAKLFLPVMLKSRKGKIMNVASTAAFQPGPRMAVYYATKAYVLSFSEALAEELRGTGVTVTTLCPGPTRSEFQKRAGIENINMLRWNVMMSSEEVARYGYEALMRGRRIAVPGLLNKFGTWGSRFVPRGFVTFVVSYLQNQAQ